jgi:three-Cys-motif partner protein
MDIQKLDSFQKYLEAYTKLFAVNDRAQHLRTVYVDAFAGEGKLTLGADDDQSASLFAHDRELKGSALRALELSPPFDEYIFVEKNSSRCEELRNLSARFTSLSVQVVNRDANDFLKSWSAQPHRGERAVVLLDPFAMDVDWVTLSNLSKTRIVDLWYLFPCGAFNRLLTRSRKPPESWGERISRILGTNEWKSVFYKVKETEGLFGPIVTEEKISGFNEIFEFVRKRLLTIFVDVVEEPMYLVNATNSPIFMFFFAASNERGATTGKKIAKSIIKTHGH